MAEESIAFPALDTEHFDRPSQERLVAAPSQHRPRFLMLCGSVRERSYSRLLTFEFTEEGRMKPSAYYDRVVDVMEELFKFTLFTRDVSAYLVDRYSVRTETAVELSRRVNQRVL